MKCKHKRKHKTKTSARRAQTVNQTRLKRKYKIYKCPECKFYHLATIKNEKTKKRNDKRG